MKSKKSDNLDLYNVARRNEATTAFQENEGFYLVARASFIISTKMRFLKDPFFELV